MQSKISRLTMTGVARADAAMVNAKTEQLSMLMEGLLDCCMIVIWSFLDIVLVMMED